MSAPLRVLLLGLIALLGLGVVGALTRAPEVVEAPAIEAPQAGGSRSLPAASPGAGPVLLARSAFAPDRSRYARPERAEPVEALAPLEVRLVAVFATQGAPRATLVIDGEELTVGMGDPTSAGVVTAIESDAVVLGEGVGRRVSLFE